MPSYHWIARCQLCGKTGSKSSTSKPVKPINTPYISGKCPSSSNGNHAPQWEEC